MVFKGLVLAFLDKNGGRMMARYSGGPVLGGFAVVNLIDFSPNFTFISRVHVIS